DRRLLTVDASLPFAPRMTPRHDLHLREQVAQVLGVASGPPPGHPHRAAWHGERGAGYDVIRHRLPRRPERVQVRRAPLGAEGGVHRVLVPEFAGPGPELVE